MSEHSWWHWFYERADGVDETELDGKLIAFKMWNVCTKCGQRRVAREWLRWAN